MLFSIAGLVFNSVGGNGFDSISKTKRGSYTEQKLIDGAMSVMTGRPLDKLVLSAQWLGLDAASNIADLDTLLTGNHLLSDQDGNNLGNWTLESLSDNGTDIFGGSVVCHKVTLSLLEYR